MDELLKNLRVSVNENLYLKDPESSDLGKKIIRNGIILIDEIGFENFTFRKLGGVIKSNESSIYRYFENKHNFLVYITSWFWGWKEFQLLLATNSIKDAKNKLDKAIEVLALPVKEDIRFKHIDEVALNNIIINESSKSYLTKKVDEDNDQGYFMAFKRLAERVSEMIKDVDSGYKFPYSLATTIINGSLNQHFVSKHFPTITDCKDGIAPTVFYKNMIANLLKADHE